MVSMRNCPPACFFLKVDVLCSIHVEHGFDAKPETCRLLLFNSFRCVGGYLVVSPHPELCPFELTPHGVHGFVSNHGSLLDVMAARGIASEVAPCRAILSDADRAIGLEACIADLSETYIDPTAGTFDEFIATQIAIAREELRRDTLREEVPRLHSVPLVSNLSVQAERLLRSGLRRGILGRRERRSNDHRSDAGPPLSVRIRKRSVDRREFKAPRVAPDRVPRMI